MAGIVSSTANPTFDPGGGGGGGNFIVPCSSMSGEVSPRCLVQEAVETQQALQAEAVAAVKCNRSTI